MAELPRRNQTQLRAYELAQTVEKDQVAERD